MSDAHDKRPFPILGDMVICPEVMDDHSFFVIGVQHAIGTLKTRFAHRFFPSEASVCRISDNTSLQGLGKSIVLGITNYNDVALGKCSLQLFLNL